MAVLAYVLIGLWKWAVRLCRWDVQTGIDQIESGNVMTAFGAIAVEFGPIFVVLALQESQCRK